MSATPLPRHSVRRSRRARRISLRMLPGQGLEVVLPLFADESCVPAILERHRAWIERAALRVPPPESGPENPAGSPDFSDFLIKGGAELIAPLRPAPAPAGAAGSRLAPLPEPVSFSGPDGRFPLASAALLTRPPLCRPLWLPPAPPRGQAAFLKDWVRKEARIWLEPQLQALAASLGLTYGALRFRFQKSRWGSCSAKGAINLNACLLFLPGDLARYILLHELCHTREMNHGQAFWKLVFAADPDALARDRAMRAAWRWVPAWVWHQGK